MGQLRNKSNKAHPTGGARPLFIVLILTEDFRYPFAFLGFQRNFHRRETRKRKQVTGNEIRFSASGGKIHRGTGAFLINFIFHRSYLPPPFRRPCNDSSRFLLFGVPAAVRRRRPRDTKYERSPPNIGPSIT